MQPRITGKLGNDKVSYQAKNRKKERSYLCCLQCDAAAITAWGKAARTLSRFASNIFDVMVPFTSSGLASMPVGSASRNSEGEVDTQYPEQQF